MIKKIESRVVLKFTALLPFLCLLSVLNGLGQDLVTVASLKSQLDGDFSPTDTETIVSVEGVVVTPLNLTTSSNGQFYMQDATGGIAVFHRGAGGAVPALGDMVRVTAPVGFFNGLLQLAPDTSVAEHSVTVLSSGNELPEPWEIDFAEVANPTVMEARESGLAIARGVTISHDETTFPNSGNLTLVDGEGREFTLRIDSRTDFGGTAIPTVPVDITGVIGQFDNSAPHDSGYQLLPARLSDVVDPNAEPVDLTTVATLKGQLDADLMPTDTETIVTVEGVVTTPINLTGSSNGQFYMQDSTGGIAVFHRGAGGSVPALGDMVRVTAPVGFFNGLLQLAPDTSVAEHSVTVLSSGNELPEPWEIDFAEVANPTVMEARESGLAIARGVTISHDEATFPNSGNLTLVDGEGREFTLRIDSRTDFGGTAIPTVPVDITGVIGQFDNSAPHDSGYQLLPARLSDVVDPNAEPADLTTVATLKGQLDADLMPTDTETIVTVEGVVTTPINLTGSSNGQFYMQDATGGIAVFHRGAGGAVPALGDLVRVTAPVGFFNGLLQLAPDTSVAEHTVTVLSSGNELPEPWEIDFAEVANPTVMEARESGLAIARGVTISHDEATFPNSGNLTLVDGEGREFTLRIDSRTDFGGTAIPTVPVDITGVIGQFDNSAPHDSGYQLLPARLSDVSSEGGSGPEIPLSTIAELRSLVDPENFLPTDTETLFRARGIVTTHVNLTTSSSGLFYMQEGGSGIAVFHAGAAGEVPAFGDLVEVVAPLTHFNGLLELVPGASNELHSVTILSSGNEVPDPVEIDFSRLEDVEYFESIEGLRVQASNVEIQFDQDTFPQSGNPVLLDEFGMELVGNGFSLRIDSRTDIGGQAIPEGPATIIGVISQFDNSDPRNSSYQILPSRYEDIVSDNKAPIATFNVMLQNQVRSSEPANSQYDEYALFPGERIVIEVSATDFREGSSITLIAEDGLPEGAVWSIPVSEGETLTAEFTYTVPADSEGGVLLSPAVVASNANAQNRLEWHIYIPTTAEQNLVVSEFLVNPADDPESAHYNPLNRDLEGVTDFEPWTMDEFVELANLGMDPINLGGWAIGDANEIRHQFFESFELQPNQAGIVYGGPLNGLEPRLDGIPTIPASLDRFGFGLNNSGGDILRVYNADGYLVQRIVFSGNDVSDSASLTFTPDVRGRVVAHDMVSELAVSPGYWITGESFDTHEFVPRVESIEVTASINGEGQFVMSWTAVPGVTYEILAADNLADGFTPLESGLAFADGNGSYATSTEQNFRFFVIRQQ